MNASIRTRASSRYVSATTLAFSAMLLSMDVSAEGKDSTIKTFFPGKNWVFQIEAPGVIETYNNHKSGLSTYFSGFSLLSGINLSIELVEAKQATSASACRDFFYDGVKDRKIDGLPLVKEWTLSEKDGVPRIESFTAEFGGKPLRQKHIHSVYLRDGVCAKAHVSKVNSDPRRHPELDAVLETVRFEPVDAAGSVTRSFIVSRTDAAVMKMPVKWGFKREDPRNGMPLGMFVYEPTEDFQMGLRFIDPSGIPGPRDEKAIQRFVEAAKNKMLSSATESDASLERFSTKTGVAFFYQVTNKTPVEQQKKGVEWRYLYQGTTALREFLVIFSIYSNQKDSPDVVAAFDLIKDLDREEWRSQ